MSDFTYEDYLQHVHPHDQWYRLYILPEFYGHFKAKYELFKRYDKSLVAEIGVRWGYSLNAFCHANPNLEFHGFDLIDGGHGGEMRGVNTFPYSEGKIKEKFPNVKLNLYHKNSQELETLNDMKFDYIHIDGDHSYEGCYHDMEISYKSLNKGGIMHLDDYEHTNVPTVKQAIDQWVIDNNDKILKHYSYPSLRGEYIIELK